MDLLDNDLLPLMPDDQLEADDLEADNDHSSTSYDLYGRNTTTSADLLVKIPRQVHRGPAAGAQRVGRPITARKRKRVGDKVSAPAPQTYLDSQEWQDEDAKITRDYSDEVKRFKAPLPAPTESPFPVERLRGRGQQFTCPIPETALWSATTPASETALLHEPFSLRLETVNALAGKGNPGLPGSGPMRFMVAKGGLEINGGQTDTRRFIPEAEKLPDFLEPESASEKEVEEKEDEELLVPKIEPGLLNEDDMLSLQDLAVPEPVAGTSQSLTTFKRPRGRPRKHPLLVIGEAINKMGKGRSKTGCITCRKRKKKCDETKPHCINCEKNAVLCEGYAPLTTWRSGKEKAAFEDRDRSGSYMPQSPASAYASSTYGSPGFSLPPIINGIDTDHDRIFFAHYCKRLSAVLTVEGPECSAFREQMLPMAIQHTGLMHSVLALSASNIDWSEGYGKSILENHPDLTIRELEDRGHYHNDEAMAQINSDLTLQRQLEARGESPDPAVIKVRYGQMLCFVIKALAEGNTEGAHRMHLQAYEKLARHYPSDDSPFMKFVHEYFKYHVCFDQLVAPPETYPLLQPEEFWANPKTQITIGPVPLSITDASSNDNILAGHSGGIFGLQQDFYNSFMRRIGKIRYDIRARMDRSEEPYVGYAALYEASAIDGDIKNWADATPPPPPHENADWNQQVGWKRDLAFYNIGMLYKNMLWVYLYRTTYPPSTNDFSGNGASPGSSYVQGPSTLAFDPRIKHAVDQGIGYMQKFKADDPCQTMILSPAFLIGCAAFEEGQRAAIRRIVRRVKNYTTLKNADPAMRVMEEVWKRMDGKGDQMWKGESGVLKNSKGQRDGGRESSWDWQIVARDLGVDFLAT